MNNLTLVISDTLIHQDTNGHYSLNDFHQAAGGEDKHKPANFLRLDNTKALIEEIDHFSDLRSAVEVINGGNNRGTYAVKEIVYAYAMWISPAFSLKVIRAYDALVSGQLSDTSHTRQLLTLQADYIGLMEDHVKVLNEKNDLLAKMTHMLQNMPGRMRSWTLEEDEILLKGLEDGQGPTAIGMVLGRSRDSVNHRRKLLGDRGILA